MPNECLDPGAGVAAHQHPGPEVFGELGQGGVEDRDLVRGVVGVCLPRSQQPGQRFTGPTRTVVDEREHRVEPEPALEVRGRLLLLRVRTDQGGIEIDDDLPVVGEGRAVRPDLVTSLRTSGTDRRDRLGRSLAQSIDQAADRGIGGHRAEKFGLGADHADVGQTITTQRDRDREIEHGLTRVVDRTSRPPRHQPLRERLRQPADARRREQHRGAR